MPKWPDTLHHYASGIGMLGILKEQEIWASSIYHLNDASEFEHGMRLIYSAFDKLALSAADDQDRLGAALCLDLIKTAASPIVFVASLSEDDDSLSQWRGYCPPSNGYCVGLNSEKLGRAATESGFLLQKCVYQSSDQEHLAMQVAGYVLGRVKRNLSPVEGIGIKEAAQHRSIAYNEIYAAAASMKHPKFSDEREWRLSGIPALYRGATFPTTELRQGAVMLTPFVRVPLNSNRSWVGDDGRATVSQIRIGPMPYQSLTENALKQHSIVKANDILVARSEIPYRAS
jgi:Protein of unknown function (DUF2971)